MKAAVFYEKGVIRVEEAPVQEPKEDEVMLRVKAAGVCGTDMHIYQGAQGATECNPPVILGHEFSGIVEKVGAKVTRVKPGDHVTVDPNISCGSCYHCRVGKPHFCDRMVATGVNFNGGFAEYCTVLEKQVFVLPEEMPFAVGAMCEPLSCCLHGMDLAEVKTGDAVVIIGGGTIGLIMVQLARLSGAAMVAVLEPMEERRKMALEAGADLAVDSLNQEVKPALEEANFGNVDVVIECVGRKETMLQAIDLAGKGGRAVLFGLTPPDCEIPFLPFAAFQKELTVKASYVNPLTQARAVRLLSSGRLNLAPLISDQIPIDRIEEAFTKKHAGKVVILP